MNEFLFELVERQRKLAEKALSSLLTGKSTEKSEQLKSCLETILELSDENTAMVDVESILQMNKRQLQMTSMLLSSVYVNQIFADRKLEQQI